MRKGQRSLYLHTLDGKPAQFVENGDDSYIEVAGGMGKPAPLASSLRQIRAEQQAATRANCRIERDYYKRLGYVRVEVPRG